MTDNKLSDAYQEAVRAYEAAKAGIGNRVETFTGDSNEGGHLFQSDRGHHSNLMAASLVSSRGPVLVMSWRRSPGQVFAQGLD
jgi:hypothetical protein